MPEQRPAVPRVVIIGGGFGGAYCAQALERRLRKGEAHVILIDRQNYFVFYPLLVEAGSGSVEPRHAVVSIRSFLRRAEFKMAEVTGIDTARREILTRVADGAGGQGRLSYDHLVIAAGSITRMPPVPGLREHGFQMKGLSDAVGLRDRVIQMLELADMTEDPRRREMLLHFVVVGANFTGAEIAGEMDSAFRSATREYENLKRSDIRITLIDHGDRVLAALDKDLGDYAQRNMEKRGIEIRLRESVAEIHRDRVVLKSGETLSAATVIWAAGIAPPPLIASTDLPVDDKGYMVCDPDLRVHGLQNVWGIGDCAVNKDPQGNAYPATAQHAVREGAHAAKNIVAAIRGQPTTPCLIRSRGSLAALGCRIGVARVMGVNISGFWAWWLWRTVYLAKMPGFSRKARIALDWTLGVLFPSDMVQLGVHKVVRTPEVPAAGTAAPAEAAHAHGMRVP